MFYFIEHVRAGVRQRRGAAGQGVRVNYACGAVFRACCSVDTDPSILPRSSVVLVPCHVLSALITMTTYDDDNFNKCSFDCDERDTGA